MTPPPPKNAIYLSERENRARHGLGKVYRNSLYMNDLRDFQHFVNSISELLLIILYCPKSQKTKLVKFVFI